MASAMVSTAWTSSLLIRSVKLPVSDGPSASLLGRSPGGFNDAGRKGAQLARERLDRFAAARIDRDAARPRIGEKLRILEQGHEGCSHDMKPVRRDAGRQ